MLCTSSDSSSLIGLLRTLESNESTALMASAAAAGVGAPLPGVEEPLAPSPAGDAMCTLLLLLLDASERGVEGERDAEADGDATAACGGSRCGVAVLLLLAAASEDAAASPAAGFCFESQSRYSSGMLQAETLVAVL